MTRPSRLGKATVFARTTTPLGNGAFTADGRLVVSHHPMFGTTHRVSVFDAQGSLSPFPNEHWNTPCAGADDWLDAVLGVRDDGDGRVWMLDMGTRSGVQPKMVVWDTRADVLWRVYTLAWGVLSPFSEPNDFVIDAARQKAYIADEGAGGGGDGSRAALIVLDLQTGQARRRLDGRAGLRAEPHSLCIDGHPIVRKGSEGETEPLRVGADGIALDHAGEWLYISPLNGRTLWRLRVKDLLDEGLDDERLGKRLEGYAAKPNSGGMCINAAGDLYLTEIEASAIGVVRAADRQYERVLVHEDMFWPDGVMYGPDGALYVVVTQLPRSPVLSQDGEAPHLPFKVFRYEPEASV